MDRSKLVVHIEPGEVPQDLAEFAAAKDASFFQSPQWLRLVSRIDGRYQPWVPCVRRGEQLVAALPMLEVRQYRTRRLYGGPWGTYGGVIAHDATAAQALLAWLQQQAPSFSLVRLHDFCGSLSMLDTSWSSVQESSQVIELANDPKRLFADAFTAQNRNKIRKAEKNDVQVQCRDDAEALQAYADLYARLASRVAVSIPLSRGLLVGLAGCPGVQVWLAHRHDEVIAGLLNFRWGGQIMNWGNVSSPESWKYAPNNLLHWKALEHACLDASGPRLYNFGSSAVSEKVYTFKKSFGAVDHVYPRRQHTSGWLRLLNQVRRRGA